MRQKVSIRGSPRRSFDIRATSPSSADVFRRSDDQGERLSDDDLIDELSEDSEGTEDLEVPVHLSSEEYMAAREIFKNSECSTGDFHRFLE